MDIGSKIKSARVEAELTQEQAAEALGVSRQTMISALGMGIGVLARRLEIRKVEREVQE